MKTAPVGRVDVVRTGVLSISLADIPIESSTFSVVDCAPIDVSIGSWLPPSLTVMVTTSESTEAESSVA